MMSFVRMVFAICVASAAAGCALGADSVAPRDDSNQVETGEPVSIAETNSQPGGSPCERGVPLILPDGEVAWMPADCSPQEIEPGDPSPQIENPMRDPRLDELAGELTDGDGVAIEAR